MLRSFLALSSRERLLVLEAAALLAGVGAAIRVVTCARIRSLLDSLPTPLFGGEASPADVGWAVNAADGTAPGERICLVRALVAEALLRRRGRETALRFGVDGADDVAAHAWLESGGEIVVGGETREEYTRLEAGAG